MQGLGFFLLTQVAAAGGEMQHPFTAPPVVVSLAGQKQVEGVSLTADGLIEKRHEGN